MVDGWARVLDARLLGEGGGWVVDWWEWWMGRGGGWMVVGQGWLLGGE